MKSHGEIGCPPARAPGEMAFWGVEREDGDYEARIIKVCKWSGMQIISRHLLKRDDSNKISFLLGLLKNAKTISGLSETTGIMRLGRAGWYQ